MRALVLEGGGAKGSFQAGAIKAFNDRNIYFDVAVGTSIGAVNAAFYASKSTKNLFKLWHQIESKDLFGFDNSYINDILKGKFNKFIVKKGFNDFSKIIKNKGIDISSIRNYLNKYLDEDKLRKSDIDFGLVTYNLTDKKPVEIFKKDIPNKKLMDYILASSYLPIFKFEKIIDNKYYVDGGFHSNLPLHLIDQERYDEIFIVRIWKTNINLPKKKNGNIHVIAPQKSLGPISVFSKETAKENFLYGYYETIKYLDKLDGYKYYFKFYSKEYYNRLFNKNDLKEMKFKYSFPIIKNDNKTFIIKVLEEICEEMGIKKYKVHNIPYLITKLKYKVFKNNSKYFDFIRKIKIDFN